jgi:chromate reductase, NAD(P)H dehydrogenase (quinone)
MPVPKILVFAGSIRSGSFNARLAALAVKELALMDVDVTHLSLADYPLPIYDGDLEAQSGAPDNAVKLKRQMITHRGILIVSPEYNASVTPLLKNTLDWISRVREGGEQPLAAYKRRVFALAAASNGTLGGYRSLMALRQILELGCGASVLPEQIALREAATAFDDNDNLRDQRSARLLKTVLERLVDAARHIALRD